ncbi:MAG: zinc ribbon domain-containing protein [Thermoplasmata archaeon]|nr:zinc ribbon domain-containing protein [Thermoplasmata archaeon]
MAASGTRPLVPAPASARWWGPATPRLRLGSGLSSAGGLLIAGFGALFLAADLYLSPQHPDLLRFDVLAELLVEIALGALVIVLAWWVLGNPARRQVGGVLVIVFGLASLELPPGGFILGPIMAFVGGLIALTAPSPPAPATAVPGSAPTPLAPWRTDLPPSSLYPCPSCGRPNPIDVAVCVQCGAPLG